MWRYIILQNVVFKASKIRVSFLYLSLLVHGKKLKLKLFSVICLQKLFVPARKYMQRL